MSVWSIVGGVIAFIVLAIVIVIVLMRKHSNSNQRPPSSNQLYTAYHRQPDPEPYTVLNQTNVQWHSQGLPGWASRPPGRPK